MAYKTARVRKYKEKEEDGRSTTRAFLYIPGTTEDGGSETLALSPVARVESKQWQRQLTRFPRGRGVDAGRIMAQEVRGRDRARAGLRVLNEQKIFSDKARYLFVLEFAKPDYQKGRLESLQKCGNKNLDAQTFGR